MTCKAPEVIYYGEDLEFFSELNKFVVDYYPDKFLTRILDFSNLPLSQLLKASQVAIAYIDFTSPFLNHEKIRREVREIKRTELFKQIIFIGLFSTSKQCEEHLMTVIEGLTFFQIKGSEEQLLFTEVFSLALTNIPAIQHFSQAGNLNMNLVVSSLACLDKISPDGISIESDVYYSDSGDGQDLKLSLTLFSENEELAYPVTQRFQGICHYPLFHYYQLEFPFAGAWEDEDENSIQPDTVETWIDLNSDKIKVRQNVVIFTQSENFILDHITSELDGVKAYTFDQAIVDADLDNVLEILSPKVIFYEFNDEYFSYEYFQDLIQKIKEFDSGCILVALNTPSMSSALQKMFGYQSILASEKIFELKLFTDLVQRLSKGTTTEETNQNEYMLEDRDKLVLVNTQVLMLSLSEHVLAFKTTLHLPLFTVLSIDLPVKALLTITSEQKIKDEYHYNGIIHGVDSHQREILRRIVNQFIYNTPKELNHEVIKFLLGHKQDDQKTTLPNQTDISEKNKNLEKDVKVSGDEFKLPARPTYSKI